MSDTARFSWAQGLSLDMKLGGRMLARYPGITLVGGLAMAFAIWFGAVTFEMLGLFLYPSLPLPDGDRIVKVYNWDAKGNALEPRATHDFLRWRTDLHAVEQLGAFRDVSRNLTVPGGETREVQVAEMSASGFVLSSGQTMMGRTLSSSDERGDAAPVVVIGYTVWQERFGSDAGILGKSVRIGDAFATVVGVMKEGYAFPVSHEAWMPLHLEQLDQNARSGVPITVFGKLAKDASIEKAQAELDLIGQRMASEFKTTHEFLKPRVTSYVANENPSGDAFQMSIAINIMVAALLTLICGNVALLMFARAATRESELTVRSALGASRARIVMQLFAEALVLGAVAAVVGLAAAALTLRLYGMTYLEVNLGRLPFWFDTDLSPLTVLYAALLTVTGAVIAGVLPALRVTRGISAKLRQGTSGAGLKFSGVWTFVIVAQVAATVLLPAIVLFEQSELSRIQTYDVGFASGEYLAVQLQLEAPVDTSAAVRDPWRERASTTLASLRNVLATEPGVRGVTFVSDLPAMSHGGARIQLADSLQIPDGLRYVNAARVDINYFDVLGAPILSGRGFHSGETSPAARSIIVDLGFVRNVLQGSSPLGRRIRLGSDPNDWYEIIGVVKDLGMNSPIEKSLPAGIYLPRLPGQIDAPQLMVHGSGDPLVLAPRIRAIAESVDPTIRLNAFTRLDRVSDPMVWFVKLWRQITMILTGIAVLLSLAGIYAVLAFTVSKRTREIGVRIALGATPRLVAATIFRRPLVQVSIGIAAGALLVGLGSVVVRNHKPDGDLGMHILAGGLPIGQFVALIAYAALMLGVCLLACIVPTRRALGVQPTEALRSD
ncbi:MAG: ABC transporter permease [Gemmatimonas sp.]